LPHQCILSLTIHCTAAGCEASLSNTLKAVGLESQPEGLKGVTKIAATACKVGWAFGGAAGRLLRLCIQAATLFIFCLQFTPFTC